MSALPSIRPCPLPSKEKRCSPVSGDLTHGSLGVRYDSATGLHYMRARWYDSGLGRFISRDPIGLRGGSNLYAYVSDSPVNYTDPNGLVAAAGAMALAGCLFWAYWRGKQYEAHEMELKVPTTNKCGVWVYDKYVHCWTACEMQRCFLFAGGVVGGAVGGGASGGNPIGIGAGTGAGVMTGGTIGGVSIATAGAAFELAQALASKAWGGNPMGHGSLQDAATNLTGISAAYLPGSCEKVCGDVEMEGD